MRMPPFAIVSFYLKAGFRRCPRRRWGRRDRASLPSVRMATIEQFNAIDIRVGTVVEVAPFPEARKPAFQLVIDFGPEIGSTSIQCAADETVRAQRSPGSTGRRGGQFPARRIAGFVSDVLVLGAMPAADDVILLMPDRTTPNGSRIA